MEYTRPTPGVPDESGPPTMTPPSHDQLDMTSGDERELLRDLEDQSENKYGGRVEYIRLFDKEDLKWRPAVLTFPVKGSYCVVHTPEDYPRKLKCMTRHRFMAFVEPKMEPWYPSARQIGEIERARRGHHDDDAEEAGLKDPYSYVLHRFEEEKEYDTTWQDIGEPTNLSPQEAGEVA